MFTGTKVSLRAFELSDTTVLHEMLNEPALLGCRYIDHEDGPLSLARVEEMVEAWSKPEQSLRVVVTGAGGGPLLGHAYADSGWDRLTAFVAVVIAPAHQRHGYGTEVLRLLLHHVFTATPALTVEAWVADWNEAGLAFARHGGFREAGRLRREGIRNGSYYDAIPFDMTRAEWEERHGP